MKTLNALSQATLCSVLLLLLTPSALAQQKAPLAAVVTPSGEFVIVIQSDLHERFGFLYPMTYQLDYPPGSTGLRVEEKSSSVDAWNQLPEKLSTDYFDGVEAVRFDDLQNRAFVSAAFRPTSDSLFLRITDQNHTVIAPSYRGISKYYDNRRAAVTVTADDWSDWTADWYSSLLGVFRSYGLYVTAGVISGGTNTSPATWRLIQEQLDSGLVEIAAHSRTHPDLPYVDPYGEVVGCFDDIVNNVTLPAPFGGAGKHYVYVWLAPYGHFDDTVDSLMTRRSYIVSRLYPDNGDSTFGVWNSRRSHFSPIFPTREIGAPSWGGGSTNLASLNATFDTIVGQGGVYHFMWHPQTVFDDRAKPYFLGHLDYISRRTDIWYANLGPLYLYHFLQQGSDAAATSAPVAKELPTGFELQQNYPNPFNPTTTIEFTIPGLRNQVSDLIEVRLVVCDVLGRQVATLVKEKQGPGNHRVTFDATGLSSGVYFYRLEAGGRVLTKSMALLR